MDSKFELPDGSYSVSDIQDCFKNIKKHKKVSDTPLTMIYINEIENELCLK